MAQVRYIVNDVRESIAFYVDQLGFSLRQQFGPAMAIIEKADLTVWLAGPPASASKPMPDGAQPRPGGWARFVLTVEDLDSLIGQLKSRGVTFRNDVVEGPGGRQILCNDPSGNIIELFEAH